MGCGGSSEAAPPAKTSTGGYRPPPPPSASELERQAREEEERAYWVERAKEVEPEPFPKPSCPPGASEEQYKTYMREKYEHETWENKLILIGRRLKTEAEAAGGGYPG